MRPVGPAPSGRDGVQHYRLSFEGEPHPEQGYHVKLTIHTPGSIGADTQHKVFWVQPCETTPPGEKEPPGGEEAAGGRHRGRGQAGP